LLEVVRYIHLNPIRARLVADYKALGKYAYCGHGVILGSQKKSWQDIEYVLGLFGEDKGLARRRYGQFVRNGIEQGKRPDLVGGGLIRSQGGWAAVKALRKTGAYQKGDERILGGSTFVEGVLSQANEQMEQKYRLAAEGFDLDWAVERVAELMDMSREDVMDSGKGRRSVQARGILCYWATDRLGISQTRLAGILNLTQPAVSQSVNRGKRLARMHKYFLIDEKNL
jgi:putative transposase